MTFSLDPVLAGDTEFVCDLALSRVLLMRDARYPWLVLVPMRSGLVEISDMKREERLLLSDETDRAARALQKLYEPEKINMGALGNIVRQLHIHIVARMRGDPAWPGPVWGHSPATPYEDDALAIRLKQIAAELEK